MANFKILFLGPAGSGKGTQSARLATEYNLQHISTGDLIRAEIKSGSELGNKVKAIVESGKLVSDDIVNEIVANKIKGLQGFILDGYPRTLEQAQFLSAFVKFDFIFDLEVPEQELIKRLSGRRMCSRSKDPNCKAVYHLEYNPPQQNSTCDLCGSDLYQRPDDSESAIMTRLAGYQNETGKPLTGFYKNSNLIQINASTDPDQVFETITQCIAKSSLQT